MLKNDGLPASSVIKNQTLNEQELSYRQQIARQLHTQYAEGIYRHTHYTVTFKYRLRVTQGHWKWNHWVDRTRLTISRVTWSWILSWPRKWVGGHSRSLKMTQFDKPRMTFCWAAIIIIIIIKNECHSNILVDRLQGCSHSKKLRESESESRSSKVVWQAQCQLKERSNSSL